MSTVAGCQDSAALPAPLGDDDSDALQAAITRLARAGGGVLRLAADAVFRCRRAPVVLEGVTLDLNGSVLELLLGETNDQGVRLRSRATLCNGTVRVRSSGTPSAQAGAHAPVCVGPLYGNGGTPSSPSPDEGVTGWAIRDLVLACDKQIETSTGPIGAAAIQITGGAAQGVIERISVPDSNTLSGAVHLDWGTIGSIVSADDPAGLVANRRLFDARRGWTTHPHAIVIRDIRIGRLIGGRGGPDGGADAIRLSGCRDVVVRNVRAAATSGVFLRHTAGDLGLEYATPDAAGLTGNRFIDCRVDDCLNGRLFVSDSCADNVARGEARGYRPRVPALLPTDVVFNAVEGRGRGRADGGLFVNQRGGAAIRCRAEGFGTGFKCDAGTVDIVLRECTAIANRAAGFLVEHVGQPPRDCRLVAPVAVDNGGTHDANIVFGASIGSVLDGGTIGNGDRRDSAGYGVWIKERKDGCIDAEITGTPTIRSHATGGAAFRVSSDQGWGALRLFAGAHYAALVDRRWVGLSIVPTAINASGRTLTVAPNRSLAPPGGFPQRPGDRFVSGPLG